MSCGARKNGTSAVCTKDIHYDGEHRGKDNLGEEYTWMHDERFTVSRGAHPEKVYWKFSSIPYPRPESRGPYV